MTKAGRTAHRLLTGLSVVPDESLGYRYDRQATRQGGDHVREECWLLAVTAKRQFDD